MTQICRSGARAAKISPPESGAREAQTGNEPGPSADGLWWRDGTVWWPAVSADGRWRYTVAEWTRIRARLDWPVAVVAPVVVWPSIPVLAVPIVAAEKAAPIGIAIVGGAVGVTTAAWGSG